MSDDRIFVLPETSTYFLVLDSQSFVTSSFGFRLLDLNTAPILPLASPTTTNVETGHLSAYRFSENAAQTFSFDIQNVTSFFRVTYQLIDPAGNAVTFAQSGNKLSASLMVSGTYSLLMEP